MGFSLSSLTSSLVNPISLAQLAMGPAGWASLAMRTVGTAIAKEVIQEVGQQLGLPQGMINMVQNGFSAATGTIGGPETIAEAVSLLGQAGLSPAAQGELQRAAQQDKQDIFEMMTEATKEGKEKAEKEKSKGDRSWLQKIADALSKVIDSKIEEMDRLSTALDEQGTNRSAKTTTDLQVAGQEFSYLMNTASTVIKTMGEGLSGMARKQ